MLAPPARCARAFAATTVAVVSAACAWTAPRPAVYDLHGATMGTQFAVKVVADPDQPGSYAAVRSLVDEQLAFVDERMSHYRPESEISRFNRFEGTTPFPVSDATFEVLTEAQRVAVLTDGAFDVTVGPLVEAWGFGVSARQDPPSRAEVEVLRDRLGFDLLHVDASGPTVRKDHPQLAVDLSAIAKGYGVDRVADALEAAGFGRYMIEVGGEVRTAGLNDRSMAWQIAVERPESGTLQRVVPLSGWAMATSGDYRNYYEWEGRRVSHTIDPRTGQPVQHDLASVTVVARNCMLADALATALTVLGPEEGLRFAVARDVAALMLVRDSEGGFEEQLTPAFDRLID